MEKDARREAREDFLLSDFLDFLSLSESLSLAESYSSSPVCDVAVVDVVDAGSLRPGERREMRLMKRVRFLGVFKPFLLSPGEDFGLKRRPDLVSAAEGASDAVVAMDQRDWECSKCFGAHRWCGASSVSGTAAGVGDAGETLVLGRDMRLGDKGNAESVAVASLNKGESSAGEDGRAMFSGAQGEGEKAALIGEAGELP